MKTEQARKVPKPWGQEIWFAVEDEYLGKILEMKKGYRSSMHFHRSKKETMYVLEGEVRFEDGDGKTQVLREGESITINPGEKHRINPLKDSRILESSTPGLDDVVRVDDDYERLEK